MSNPTWNTLTCSVRGASHIRISQPNQDFGWPLNPLNGPEAVIAVADGHGSARSFRSNMGARIAALTTKSISQDFLKNRQVLPSLSATKDWAENGLPKEIVRTWQAKVDDHIKANPFTEIELAILRNKEGEKRTAQVIDEPIIAYGSTLLCALLTGEFIIYGQLGDGDILVVSDDGKVTRPIPRDERLIANETTSLCLPKAWEDFHVSFQPINGNPPSLVMLSTDGYANSFRDETAFLQTGPDFLKLCRGEGIEYVHRNLPEWLNEASQLGSGDDVTLGIGWCKYNSLNLFGNQQVT